MGSCVLLDKLRRRQMSNAGEIETLDMREQRAIKRNLGGCGYLLLAFRSPVRDQSLAQLLGLLEQVEELGANAARSDEPVCPWDTVFTEVCVIAEFPELHPDVAWRKRMVVMLALVVVPKAGGIGRIDRGDDIASHVSGTTGALDKRIARKARRPFVDRRLPLIGREQLDPFDGRDVGS